MSVGDAAASSTARAVLLASMLAITGCHSGQVTPATEDAATDAETDASVADALVLDDGHPCGSASMPPSCAYDPSLTSDASTAENVCETNRVLLTCSRDGGGGAVCLGDGVRDCYGRHYVDGHPQDGCESRCCPDEYAVSCRSPLPPGCRSLRIVVPAGYEYACCPCR